MANPYVKQTWTDGVSAASAARMAVIEQGIFDAHIQPAARVNHSAAQSITSAVLTALAFNSERFDQDGLGTSTIHDTVTNNSRLTCRVAGKYLITGTVEWASSPTIGSLAVRLNGGTVIAYSVVVADYRVMGVTTIWDMAVNDYVELMVNQTSGGAVNINSTSSYSPEFSIARVG